MPGARGMPGASGCPSPGLGPGGLLQPRATPPAPTQTRNTKPREANSTSRKTPHICSRGGQGRAGQAWLGSQQPIYKVWSGQEVPAKIHPTPCAMAPRNLWGDWGAQASAAPSARCTTGHVPQLQRVDRQCVPGGFCSRRVCLPPPAVWGEGPLHSPHGPALQLPRGGNEALGCLKGLSRGPQAPGHRGHLGSCNTLGARGGVGTWHPVLR